MKKEINMSFTFDHPYTGRLCNQIFRNICLSMVAENHDLKVLAYSSSDRICQQLGIPLFTGGSRSFETRVQLNDDNFVAFLLGNNNPLNEHNRNNLDANSAFFQTKEISRCVYDYLRRPEVADSIVRANPYAPNGERSGATRGAFTRLEMRKEMKEQTEATAAAAAAASRAASRGGCRLGAIPALLGST